MSGIDSKDAVSRRLDLLEAVLDRRQGVDLLGALVSTFDKTPEANQSPRDQTAIGIDSSALLRLSKHRRSADLIDYLRARQGGALILPSQAVQEFWNNQLNVIDTMGARIKKKFDALKVEMESSELAEFGPLSKQMVAALDSFNDEFGYVYDPTTKTALSQVMALFRDKALCVAVPRVRFRDLADIRKRTKTPPGFKDDGHGDFFIWVEFLYGLLMARESGATFDSAVIVTADKKLDWTRDKVAHPVLSAEVRAVVDVPFHIWEPDTLATRLLD